MSKNFFFDSKKLYANDLIYFDIKFSRKTFKSEVSVTRFGKLRQKFITVYIFHII